MLLKIVTGDHLNSQLLDVKTGIPRFTTVSRYTSGYACNLRGSTSSRSTGSSSSSTSSSSLTWDHQVDRFADGSLIPVELEGRHTWILDAEGNVLGEIVFSGGYPMAIKLAGKEPITGRFCPTGVFSCLDIRADNDVLLVRTCVDDFEWIATKSSMTLEDSDEQVAMQYYPNARIDGTGRIRSARLLRGNAFLEIHETVDYLDIEELTKLLVTFCLMVIIRCGRFHLTPYVHIHESASALVRYRALLRAKYIGAGGWRLQQLFRRLGRDNVDLT